MDVSRLIKKQLRPYNQFAEPQPIHLHWTWLLILSIVLGYWTGPLFIDIWLVIQANWIRLASDQRRGLKLTLGNLGLDCVMLLLGLLMKITHLSAALAGNSFADFLGFVNLAMFLIYLGAIYEMRRDMGNEPIGLALGPVMTFFFGPYYFQYWLQDYAFVRRTSPSLRDVPATSPKPLQ